MFIIARLITICEVNGVNDAH